MNSRGKRAWGWRGLPVIIMLVCGGAWQAAATPIPWTIENVSLVLPGSADVYTLTGGFTLDVADGHLTDANVWLKDTSTGSNYFFADSVSDLYQPGMVRFMNAPYLVEIFADYSAILSPYVAGAIPITGVRFGTSVRSYNGTLDFSLSPQLYTPDVPPQTPEPAPWLLVATGLLLLAAAAFIRRGLPEPRPAPARRPPA